LIEHPKLDRFLTVSGHFFRGPIFQASLVSVEMTKDDRNLNFQLVAHPKLYRFFTKIKFRFQRFGKTGRFPVVFSVLRTAPTDGAARHHPLNIELVLNQNRPRNTTASLAARMI
jgi:hypothetical protein